MGHSEMLLAVAGLDRKTIADQTRHLAGGDWARFGPAERAALEFARKQAREPAAISGKDVQELAQRLGTARALDVIWWTCQCHYMTCIASAFQLPLEDENVFDGFLASSPGRESPATPAGSPNGMR
jgi:alkylhydroperoxidase family enzyme